MIDRDRLVLLDTGVLLNLIRGNRAGRRIDDQLQLRARSERPLLSVVSVGEIRALARVFNWGPKKWETMEALLRELVIVDINVAPILTGYGELKAFAQSGGHGIGDNDLWIAATARATHAILITSDRDFDPFSETHIERIWIDPDIDR